MNEMRKKILEIFLSCNRVCTDTRKIQKGAVFFALKGDNFNGNKFAHDALNNGCDYAVIDEPNVIPAGDNRYILVDNVLTSLQNLATDYKNTLNAKIVAITGSNGKTTTKELTAKVLGMKYKVAATPGNFNNHIGLPLTILSAPKNTEILLLEMGDNQPGDIKELCEIAEPHYGIITNIGKDHIEGFGTFEGNIKSKDELFQYLQEQGGTILYNSIIPYVPELAERVTHKIPYGSGEAIDLKLESCDPFIVYQETSGTYNYETKLIGKYNFENLLTAYALGLTFDVTVDDIHQALCNYEPKNNRSQYIQTKAGNDVILDAYNANPSSVEPALENFNELDTSKKKLIILGDMLELGNSSAEEHENIVMLLRNLAFDDVVLVGTEFAKVAGDFLSFKSTDDALNHFNENPVKERAVLVKGSRGLKLERVLDSL